MNSAAIEALYIFDEHNNPVLAHTYAARPLPASQLLPLYLTHPAPRPSLIHLSHTAPPTLVFSLRTESDLLLLATASAELEPLLALEFLHRVVDALEDFLGAPLVAARIEASYDVVAQLLTEMCDAGLVGTTEPNALRDVVEVEGWMGKLLGNLSLPGKTSPTPSPTPSPALVPPPSQALPWRQSNVRHSSNEMYADIVESLSVIMAPSGRPLAAFANGTIAFTSKISGVPDISLTLTSSGGRQMAARIMELPVFHPCVRLVRWKESPGEMSFIPPDGRCVLAGYGVDLMPAADSLSAATSPLKLPVSLEMRTGLGPTGADFDVRVTANHVLLLSSGPGARAGGGPPSSSSPRIEELVISIPLPADVRNLPDIRPSKGDANYNPGTHVLEWHIPTKVLTASTHFSLRCTVLGPRSADDDSQDPDPTGFGFGYDEPYQAIDDDHSGSAANGTAADPSSSDKDKDERRARQNKLLMPTSATASFAVKGWLASGLRVESIMLNLRKSKGVGEAVKPYKGVKYLTVSKKGVEIRC